MISIYFALGSKEFEEYIINELRKNYFWVGRASYASALEEYIENLGEENSEIPDIFMIKINLQEMTQKRCFKIIQNIKLQLGSRIILFSQDEKQNYDFHKNIVALGVYDIVLGNNFDASEVISCILYPKTIADNRRFISKEFQQTTLNVPKENSIDEVQSLKQKSSFFTSKKKLDKNSPQKDKNSFSFWKKKNKKDENANSSDVKLHSDASDISVGETHTHSEFLNLTKNSSITMESDIRQSLCTNDEYYSQDDNDELYMSTKTTIDHEENIVNAYNAKIKPFINATDELNQTRVAKDSEPVKKVKTGGSSLQRSKNNNKKQLHEPICKSKGIISFLSLLDGEGCSTVALNAAINLSFGNKKILFVELNTEWSCINTVYGFTYGDSIGIDFMIEQIENNFYEEAINSIVTNLWLREVISSKFINNMPNIDFLSFSNNFIKNKVSAKSPNSLSEFLTFITMRTDYDYIVFDVGKNFTATFAKQVLGFSKTVFTVITQSMNSIFKYIETIEHNSLDFQSKNHIIINRYIPKTSISKEHFPIDIYQGKLIVSDYAKDIINFEAEGIPIATNKKHEINQELASISKIINRRSI